MFEKKEYFYKVALFIGMAVILFLVSGIFQVDAASAALGQITATPTPVVTTLPPNGSNVQNSFGPSGVGPFVSTIYYVNISGGNDGNTCTTIAAPCQHIQEAVNKAVAGDVINVATGTYTFSSNGTPNVVIINKNLKLSGGWNSGFTTQTGASVIDGANANNGILAVSGTVNVENFVVKNSKSYNGGAVYIVNGSFTLTRSTLMNNVATQHGAGIFLDNGTLNVVNSTVTGNKATSGGGGIYVSNNAAGSAFIQNSTVAYNTAGTGGGIRRSNGTYNITNSIIANNSSSNSGPDCAGTIAVANYNIIEDVTGCSITGGSNNLNVDPAIENSLSGSILSHALMLGSPAIDAGTSVGCPSTDQLGLSRPQGSACDIGSIEYMDFPPTVLEVTRAGLNNTSAALVAFAVNFSENVTGVDANDFALTTTGVSGAVISSVSGSGSIYSVTVNTGSGNGTIRLDVLSNGGIVDAGANSLSSAFTSGEVYTIVKTGGGGPSLIAYSDLVVDEGRNRLYGADKNGNKIDVVDLTDLSVIGSYTLAYGTSPISLDLSPDGNELAVAQSGTGYVAFVNLSTSSISQIPSALSGSSTKVTDVIYGRAGILYVLSSNGLHVIDLTLSPHSEIVTQYLYDTEVYEQRFGAISSDKNTLYIVTGTCCSGYDSLGKYNISNGLAKPVLLDRTHLYATGYVKNIRLNLINDENLLVSNFAVYNTSNLTPRARNSLYSLVTPAATLPGKDYYVVLYDNGNLETDTLNFHDVDGSYPLSSASTNVIGTPGAIVANNNGNTLFVSSTGGMAKFNLGVTPPGDAVPLPTSLHHYRDFVFDIPRGVAYGTDESGRVDVVNLSTSSIVKSYLLPSGANPIGIDLSPDGSELAIALNGLEKLLFIDPVTGATIAEVTPDLSDSIYYVNRPFDVIYGRSGRLYSDGDPVGGTDYLHVINTVTHSWVSKSPYPVLLRTGPELEISADNQYVYANEIFSPNNIFVLDVRTDNITKLYSGPHGPVSAPKFTIAPDGSKIFTSSGQVWDGIMQSQLGALEGAPGNLIEFIPGQNMLVLSDIDTGSDVLKFISAVDYHLISTYTPSSPGGSITEMEVSPDGNMLIMNINNEVRVMSLDPTAPAGAWTVGGDGQATTPGTQFPAPLVLLIENYLGQPIVGRNVTFTAPASGPSGTFQGTNSRIATAVTDANGHAISPMFVANNQQGTYNIIASVNGWEIPFELINVDFAPYVTSVYRISPDPTAAASVDYTVTFSEAVTGVDKDDFTLTTSGVTGASIATVTGSGSSYTVKVNTGSGNG
ncbi:MAG TPA: choice-of-anchor Q domain-containing protein, partial [Anaerolineales bacterium]|nr:choice-of-anchor Q domain-containing protein [Anaerolineales bacterium]